MQRVLNEWKIKTGFLKETNKGFGETETSNEGHLGKGKFLD